MKTIKNLTNSGTVRVLIEDGKDYTATIFSNGVAVVRITNNITRERFADVTLTPLILSRLNKFGGVRFTMEELQEFTPIQVDPFDPRIYELAEITEITEPHNAPREALVVEYGTSSELYSYGTHVATITNSGEFVKNWNGYTRTTMTHVNKFRECNGMDKLTGKQWRELPTE